MKIAKIGIDNLHVVGTIGVYDIEKIQPQELLIDLAIEVDVEKALETDNIVDAFDYTTLVTLCEATLQHQHYELIESYAKALVDRILSDDNVRATTVKVKKPQAIPNADFTWCELTAKRED
ncbi:MAG: dihydroneopterin aldolase [Chlamydiia bacterium]|nr:dihydroneopterin aldolase [Chlamydiia bacterium]